MYDIDKFEVAFEYIHMYGKRLYVEPSVLFQSKPIVNGHFVASPMLTEVRDTYALPCVNCLFITREGNRFDNDKILLKHTTIEINTVREIYEASSHRIWKPEIDSSYSFEFKMLFDYIVHNWSTIRLIKT